ncbi:uncharacterized protein BX663DRAFT_524990 [Cokeromyces recurvatus]|uniref:uncharacterized protein n=1 Tax=Cokeromyces recurvatus TaxID=90255 RepID=UPI002220C604|nr:uncharacterized protein BX663DRAFT_524990 [Cokeromyces recurvatus]KAI7898502.1 hypothetical protein BX663DRAFT_524990 [Cokeromyces recurvatus]
MNSTVVIEGMDLQHYFEQQYDIEAALLPSTANHYMENMDEFKEVEEKDFAALNNTLLIKESEIFALKEVIFKWRNRALEAELNYFDQLQLLQARYEHELKSMNSRYQRKLNEKEDMINNLKEQVDYLIIQRNNQQEEEEEDNDSLSSFVTDEDSSIIYNEKQEFDDNVKKETSESKVILDNIQNAVCAIEKELNFHLTMNEEHYYYPRKSPAYISSATGRSSSTLVDTEVGINKDISKKKSKNSALFINRIFKKAFRYKKKPTNNNILSLFDTIPRHSTSNETVIPVCHTKMITSSSTHL